MPNAVLSAVVFVIGLKLVKIPELGEIARLRRDEFWVAVVTAVLVVGVGVEQGIIVAIVLSVLLHVRRHYAPDDAVVTWDSTGALTRHPPVPGTMSLPGLVVYRFGVGIFYANASHLSDAVLALASAKPAPRRIVLLLDGVDDVDFTGGKTLLELAKELQGRGVELALAEPREEIRRELEEFGVIEQVGADQVYATLAEAVDAFKREGREQ
jgi:MFS superfamily sulfate permease-like transporter